MLRLVLGYCCVKVGVGILLLYGWCWDTAVLRLVLGCCCVKVGVGTLLC